MSGEPADIYANDRLIARGEISVVDERVAIRITELVGPKSRS
jgi:flagellar motor switch protein FliN/FliY